MYADLGQHSSDLLDMEKIFSRACREKFGSLFWIFYNYVLYI